MKVNTPEISWHAKEAIYSVDLQPQQENEPHRVATAGIDSNVRIWELTSHNKTGVSFLSNLSRHERAVNVVRFSKCGKILASGGDDGTIVLWKLSEKTDAPDIFEDESEVGKNVESWLAFKVLRGHLDDIFDVSWSGDGKYILSGSVDRTAILWDVVKGAKLNILAEAKHFVHGVAFDPLGQYAATLSCDRSLRIYNIQTKRVLHNVCKMVYPSEEGAKPQRMFHDESVVRRKLDFTSDGNLLIVPSGCLTKKQEEQCTQINTAYIFTRACLSKPVAHLPGFKQPVTIIRCCPVRFTLRKDTENSRGPAINLPYRHVFAVASSDTILFYDTQHLEPFSLIGNIHYASITDITWSSTGLELVVSSRDGFCTLVQFDKGELGELYVDPILPDAEECMEIEKEDNSKDSATQNTVESPPSQETKPRRVQITTISDSPPTPLDTLTTKQPRRVKLTTVSGETTTTPSKISDENGVNHSSQSATSESSTPKSTGEDTPEKKTPRRIQLTAVNK